jgi:adenosylcobinamide-phosphate guanylyltransferase
MVDRALDALAASRVETAYAAVSPHTPRTRERLLRRRNGHEAASGESVELVVVDTPGDGYVADLQAAMAEGPTAPTLTLAADLPLLDGAAVDAVLDAHAASGAGSLSVLSPAERKRELGASADAATERGDSDGTAVDRELAPTGINVVGAPGGDGDEAVRVTRDARLAVNVNYPADRRVAARLLAGDGPVSVPTGGVEWLGDRDADRGGDAA